MDDNRYEQNQKRRLFKNPDKAKIFGVCAGIAEYFGFEVWVVRIITVALVPFFNGGIFLGYIILCFILDPKPGSRSNRGCFGSERSRHRGSNEDLENTPYRASVREVWKAGSSPKDIFEAIEDKFSKVEQKLQKIESFVTSSQFELEKEFKKIRE